MDTYVRFEAPYHCESTFQPLGIFQVVAVVEERASLSDLSRLLLEHHNSWFNTNLPVPRADDIDERAIFWFHCRAKIVRDAWRLVGVLRNEGVPIHLRRTRTPGRIVYRDAMQIAAVPYGHGLSRKRRLPVLV